MKRLLYIAAVTLIALNFVLPASADRHDTHNNQGNNPGNDFWQVDVTFNNGLR